MASNHLISLRLYDCGALPRFVFSLGHFPRQNGTAAAVVGGAAAEGGITENQAPTYPSTPEIAWVVEELARRNLTHIVAQYFLHDDDGSTSGSVAANVQVGQRHRHKHHRRLPPPAPPRRHPRQTRPCHNRHLAKVSTFSAARLVDLVDAAGSTDPSPDCSCVYGVM